MEEYIILDIKDYSNIRENNSINNLHPIENANIKRIEFKVEDKLKIKNDIYLEPFTMKSILVNDLVSKCFVTDSSRENPDFVEKEVTILQSSLNISSIDKKINSNSVNGFIGAAVQAYSSHLHLVLRPEDIWFQIVNQFSVYVNKYSLELSDKFVDFKGKQDLVVRTQYPILMAPYDELVLKMTQEIEKSIVDPSIKSWIVPSFTTTTPIDKVVFSVALMSTLKNYYNYVFETDCGIPQVTLLGTLDDWLQLKDKVQRLKEFQINNISTIKKSMNDWVNELNPILDQFIQTINGNINKKWWNQIIRHDEESGGDYISGWITVFCLFDKDNEWIKPEKNYDFSLFDQERKEIWNKINYDSISKGFVSVPIILKDIDQKEYSSEMYAGHLASSIKNKNTIIPSLDWCLVLDN